MFQLGTWPLRTKSTPSLLSCDLASRVWWTQPGNQSGCSAGSRLYSRGSNKMGLNDKVVT